MIPSPSTSSSALSQDQRHRRLRVIELANLDTHDDLCALWRATETDDLVLHVRTDSTLHRQQFILHELAHMILGHCDGDDCAAGIRGSVFAESASGLTPKAGDRASRSAIHYATPADAGLHARDITITTPAGPCPAWRIDGDPSTWAIHIHGLGSTSVGTPRGVLAATELGYTSILVSYRNTTEGPRAGAGRSTLGDTEMADVDEAIGYAFRRGARQTVFVG